MIGFNSLAALQAKTKVKELKKHIEE